MLRTLPDRFIGLAMRHARLVVLVTFAATLVFAWFALKVRINADFTSLVPMNAKSAQLLKEYGGSATASDVLVLAVTADGSGGDIFAPARLAALSEAVGRISALPGVKFAVSPFNLVSFGGDGGRLAIRRMSPNGTAPDAAGIAGFRERLAAASYAKNLVISRDGTMLIAYFEAERRTDYSDMMRAVDAVATTLRTQGLTPYVTGSIPLSVRTRFYLNRDFTRLLALAALIIILCYAVGYRSKRGVILPLLSVLLGTLWTVGFMGLMGFSLSLVSIVAPPLILIFGNEYTIYTTSELNRVARDDGTTGLWITRAARNVSKPIAMAFLTTVVGFLSLTVTDVSQTREFAIAASVGSLSCAFCALVFLPAIYTLLPPPRQSRRLTARGRDAMSKVMRSLARFDLRFPAVILAGLALVAALFALTWPKLDFNTDSGSYYPQHDRAITDMYAIYEKAGGYEQVAVSFDAPPGRTGYFLDAAELTKVAAVEDAILSLPDVSYGLSLPDVLRSVNKAVTGEESLPTNRSVILIVSRLLAAAGRSATGGSLLANLANADFTRVTLNFRIYNSDTKKDLDEQRTREVLASVQGVLLRTPIDATSVIWGNFLPGLSFADSLRRSLFVSMAISVASILLLTVLVFRSFLHGLYSLVPLGTGLLLNFTMMALTRIPLDLTTIMVSNIAIGVGVDSAIYLVIQYRRELAASPADPAAATERTLLVMAQPVLLSSFSIVAGLLVFLTAAFRPVMYFGLLVTFALVATTFGTLVTLPSLLALDTRLRLARGARRCARGSN
jgi:predicted RND superfamily exporter protein